MADRKRFTIPFDVDVYKASDTYSRVEVLVTDIHGVRYSHYTDYRGDVGAAHVVRALDAAVTNFASRAVDLLDIEKPTSSKKVDDPPRPPKPSPGIQPAPSDDKPRTRIPTPEEDASDQDGDGADKAAKKGGKK